MYAEDILYTSRIVSYTNKVLSLIIVIKHPAITRPHLLPDGVHLTRKGMSILIADFKEVITTL